MVYRKDTCRAAAREELGKGTQFFDARHKMTLSAVISFAVIILSSPSVLLSVKTYR